MVVGTIRPIALAHFLPELLALVISPRCHSALSWRSQRHFLPEGSPGLPRSRASPLAALCVRGIPGTASARIASLSLYATLRWTLLSSLMVQGIPAADPGASCMARAVMA